MWMTLRAMAGIKSNESNHISGFAHYSWAYAMFAMISYHPESFLIQG